MQEVRAGVRIQGRVWKKPTDVSSLVTTDLLVTRPAEKLPLTVTAIGNSLLVVTLETREFRWLRAARTAFLLLLISSMQFLERRASADWRKRSEDIVKDVSV